MQTEFTCGIYVASFNECGGPKWYIKTSYAMIGLVEENGEYIM